MKITIVIDMGEDFVNYLIDKKIQSWLSENIIKERLVPAQSYVAIEPKYKSIYAPVINLYFFSLSCYAIIKVKKYSQFFELVFDEDAIVYGINVKSIELINLINFGNMSVTPYPIFTEMFDYFNQNIEELYEEYLSSLKEE